MKHWKVTAVLVLFAAVLSGQAFAADTGKVKIAILVKSLGNGFFEAARDGAQEAAKELGNVEILYQGPSQATAEGQIEIVDSLIAQKVSAIAISANDADALVPVLKKAMKAGIRVVSFDSGVSVGGRQVNLVPSATDLIGSQQVQLISELVGGKGEIAVLSATSQATNQNAWIEVMKKTLKDPKYAGLKLDAVVYGDDSSDKSYREALGLFKTYPNLKGIIAPTTVGVAATAKAIQDNNLTGKVQLTGLGLPSEMKAYILSGVCVQMALWNPIDLGYSATQIAYALVKGTIKGNAGEVVKAGRMGDIKIGANGESVMGTPFVYNKSNIEKFAAMF
jgi:rhamnose transport system substrate-binding protein